MMNFLILLWLSLWFWFHGLFGLKDKIFSSWTWKLYNHFIKMIPSQLIQEGF